jgi:hypothetical protein
MRGEVSGRFKTVVSKAKILNDGEEMPQETPEQLGAALIRIIRKLRDQFYDTSRGGWTINTKNFAGIHGLPAPHKQSPHL